MTERTKPSAATREEERRDARRQAGAGPEPTPAEARAADAVELDPTVAEHYEDQIERGANTQGEGRTP